MSYIARKKNGKAAITSVITAPVVPSAPRVRKYVGTATAAASPKHIS